MILTDENFEKEISEAKKPVLVDFWMTGCPPCDLIAPILGKLAREFEEKVIFVRVNFDDISLTVQKYGINAAPTIILFKEGKPISGFVGLRPEEEIKQWLEENLLIQELEEYVKKNGFFLNPDRKTVEAIIKSLLEREKKFGQRYCPCRKIHDSAEERKKIICPCVYHLEEIEKEGHCLCRLFVKDV